MTTEQVRQSFAKAESSSHLVTQSDCETLDVFGPSVQFLVAPQANDEAPCVLKGTIPPGGSVPLHSHQAPLEASAPAGSPIRSEPWSAASLARPW